MRTMTSHFKYSYVKGRFLTSLDLKIEYRANQLIKIVQETKNFFPNYVQTCFEQARKEFLNEETKTRGTRTTTTKSKSHKSVHNRKTDMATKKILRNDITLQP